MTVFRFTAESSATAQAVNVWHVKTPGSATSTDANQAIVAVKAFYEAIKAFMAPDIWTIGSRVITLDETPNRLISATVLTSTMTGTSRAAAQVAAGITWHTAFIGKSFTGRSFIGPLSNGGVNTDGATITSAFLAALTTGAANITPTLTGGGEFCVWSDKLDSAEEITQAQIRTGLRTQRRRLT